MLDRVNERQRAVQLKFGQVEEFLKHLLRASIGALEKFLERRIGYGLRPVCYGTGESNLNQWNCKFSISRPETPCARSFISFKDTFLINENCKRPLKYSECPSRQKYISPESCKQYHLSSRSYCCGPCLRSTVPLLSYCKSRQYTKQEFSRDIRRKLAVSRKDKIRKMCTHRVSVHRVSSYSIPLQRVHRRGFHSSLALLAKSKSGEKSCQELDKICKTVKEEKCGQPCEKKTDVCQQKKVKCGKRQQPNKENKKKEEKKIEQEPACIQTCLARGKCEVPKSVPPAKMEYVEVKCPPPKLAKPNVCPPLPEPFLKSEGPHIETRPINKKKRFCTPPPLPKPPCGPTILCPCPPPRKVHPGPCPCYEPKDMVKTTPMQPCPPKPKYPCPKEVHYCPPQKKVCDLKRTSSCEHRKKKEMPEF